MALSDFSDPWQSLFDPDFKASIPGAFDIDTGYQSPDVSLYGGDPRTDPGAMVNFLIQNANVRQGRPEGESIQQFLLSKGVPAEFADAAQQQFMAQQAARKQESGGLFSGMLSSGVEFAKEVAPLVAAAGATYFGAQGLGALLPAEAAAAGGTAAAEGGTALGSGITPGAAGVTGLTPPSTAAGSIGGGALGSGITTPIAATSPWSTSMLAPATAGGTALLGTGGAGAAGAGSAAGGATGVGTAAASGGALSRIIDGTATADDWLELVGRAAPAALGAFASDRQADAYSDLAERYMGFGAPSRDRFEASFAPGFSMSADPGYTDALDQTTKSFLHKASVAGNPADSPNAWQQTLADVNAQFAYPALNEYRRLNAGTGGLATLTAAAPSAATSAIGAERGIYDAIGGGAADVFNPPKSLSDLMREFRRAGY